MTPLTLYHYKATVQSIYDGDTIRADIDLGMNQWMKNEPLRLYGIDAPEVRGIEREDGLQSRDYLRSLLPIGTEIIIRTYKDKKGKYGRWVVQIYHEGTDINTTMVTSGHAEAREY